MKQIIALIALLLVVCAKAANPTFPDMINFVNQVTNKNYVDVRLFGAVPDNATPSDIAFRMAYTNALALNQPIFIQGQYYLTNTFVITNRGMTFFSFGNPKDFTTGPNGLPDICVHFGPLATNGFVFTEVSQSLQSDNGSMVNLSVFMENTNGGGICFVSTNGTSDGMLFNNVAVKSGTTAFAGGIGFNARFGLSGAHFTDIYTLNCLTGFMITNEVGGGSASGINQGITVLMDSENSATVMETHGVQSLNVIFNHVSTLNTLLSFDATSGQVYCGHVENRGQGRAVLKSTGTGGSAMTFYGTIEDSDNTWCFDAEDTASTASAFIFRDFTFGGHTNIGGSTDFIKLLHAGDGQKLQVYGNGVYSALYNGATLLASNAPASLGTAWNTSPVSWPNRLDAFLKWDYSTMPARLSIDRMTNLLGVNYERLFLNQYDDDFRAGVLATTTTGNNWQSPSTIITNTTLNGNAAGGWGLDPIFASARRKVVFTTGQNNYREWEIASASSDAGTPDHDDIFFNTLTHVGYWSGTLGVTNSLIVSNNITAGASVASAGGKPNAVTVGASPFVFVNNTGVNLECYFTDSAAFAVAKNGTTVFSSLGIAENGYLVLQPTNSVTITYSSTTPTFNTNAW